MEYKFELGFESILTTLFLSIYVSLFEWIEWFESIPIPVSVSVSVPVCEWWSPIFVLFLLL